LEAGTFEAGRIVRVHGVHGSVVVRLIRSATELIDFPEWVFLRIEGGLVPFLLTEESVFLRDQDHLVIGMEVVDSPSKANELIGSPFHLQGKWDDWFDSSQPEGVGLSGFEMVDQVSGKAGSVIRLEEIPGNPLLEIEIEGKSILLPWQPEFIVENDPVNRKLILRFPDGLLDL
jgi:16S rRNA processing protein RimM